MVISLSLCVFVVFFRVRVVFVLDTGVGADADAVWGMVAVMVRAALMVTAAVIPAATA